MNLVEKFGLMLGVVLITGCASVTGTRNQPVSVVSSCGMTQVSGAACRLSNDKGEWFVSNTPGSVTIQKAYGDLSVECSKNEVGRGVQIYQSSANGGVFGNILAGGLIGYAVDASSGAGFDYPQRLSVEMCRGETRTDVAARAEVAQRWFGLAEGFARNSGCTGSDTAHANAAWGAERYQFSCTKRPTLYMECLHGKCKETAAF